MSSKTKATAAAREVRPALVPKLRFPEFRDAAGWESEKVEDLVDAVTPPKKLPTSMYASSGTFPIVDQSQSDICGWTDDEEALIRENLPLIVFGDHTCILKLVTRPFAQGADGIKILKTRSKVGVSFLYQFLNFRPVITEEYKRHYSILKEKTAFFPEFKSGEQQKLAECLSSVDELTAAQARKVGALKTHKKGLMQQLFPREGETQPRLRFPEFRNAGAWLENNLGPKASKVGSGITPTGGDKNYQQHGRPFVRSQNVGWGVLLLDDIAYIDEQTHASFDSTEIRLRDVLLNITGASIGRSAVADERIVGGNVNQHVCIIRTKSDELDSLFLNQFLISERGQKQIESFQAGGNRQGLNFAQIRSFTLPLPPALDEQQRIATCLSSFDDLITAETQKLEALKTHKKGLMQQLFPAPEEVEA